MLLDKAKADMQVGGHKPFVDVDGGAFAGGAKPAMVFCCTRIVIDDAISCSDLRSQNALDLLFGRSAMQAGSDQDCHSLNGHTGIVQAAQERRQRDPIWSRSGNVTYRDCGCLL